MQLYMASFQNLQNIPIDIHANKLCDWLVSRHHCTKEWPEKIALLRQKVNAALKDMPENAVIGKVLVAANRKLLAFEEFRRFLTIT